MLWHVVLPQALAIALPALTANALFLVKETSVINAVSVAELLFVTKDINGQHDGAAGIDGDDKQQRKPHPAQDEVEDVAHHRLARLGRAWWFHLGLNDGSARSR